jgi:hypothetical protein
MKRLLFTVSLLSSLCSAATLCGQTGPRRARVTGESTSVASRFAREADDQPETLPPPTEEPVPIESYLDAVPPPDPSPPQWGSLKRPLRQPVTLPTYNYVLAAPPRLLVQQDRTQLYQRPVADAEQVYAEDERYNMPIDLYRPDGLAPPGMTGDHTLKNSHILMSYRYGVEGANGDLVGIHHVSTQRVLDQFTLAPVRQFRQQHLLLVEYAVSDDVTLTTSLPFQVNSIDYTSAGGGLLHNAYTQIGDMQLSTLYVLRRWQRHQLHANLGLSIPVNLLQVGNDMPAPGDPNLSYPMKSGSGTYDLLPGLTYRGQSDFWTWGMQSIATIRTGRNNNHFEYGNRIDINAWAWRRWTQGLATSARLRGQGWGNVHGADPRLTPTLSDTTNPAFQGGTRLDLLFGVQYYRPWVRVPGNWFSIESGFPIYQNLHGPQPRTTWLLYGGWNMMW